MNNPEITVVTVTDSPTLVFSGCGKVTCSNIGANSPNYGKADVVASGGTNWLQKLFAQDSFEKEFRANAEVYAICSTGQTTTVRVTRWF